MRWVHDLAAFNRFNRLSVDDQQRVFGRTKADSVELPPAEKPPNAHIARVEMSVDGKELEIFEAVAHAVAGRPEHARRLLASRERRLLLRAVAGGAQRARRSGRRPVVGV